MKRILCGMLLALLLVVPVVGSASANLDASGSASAAQPTSPGGTKPDPTPGPTATTTTPAPCASSTGGSSKDQILIGIGQTTTAPDCSGSGVQKIVNAVVKILTIVIGIAAVVMILFAGFKYITSAGDTNKVASAKNSLIYVIIGLLIIALAQTIVHFALSTGNDAAKQGAKASGTSTSATP